MNVTRVSTGVDGLDEMLNGGFPKGRVILICGGPGAGKTILSLQYLITNVKAGEPGIYVSLEEPLDLIRKNVLSFGWGLKRLEDEGKLKLLDLYIVPYSDNLVMLEERGRGRSNVMSVIGEITRAVENIHAKHIVLDPVTSITIHQSHAGRKRHMIGRLFQELRKLDCTSLLTMEITPSGGDFYMEKFLADGVILLESFLDERFRLIRTLRIEKMRGIRHDDQPRRYEITDRGIVVYHTEPAIE